MYTHILVPLDGSGLAEQVLPHAKMLASQATAPLITLLRSVPPIYPVGAEAGGMFISLDEQIDALQKEAQEYLDGVAEKLRGEGFRVETEVSGLPAAEAIIDYAEANDVKLITIATHGRSGISRWVFGSVTQKVLHATHTPMLVVRPTEEPEGTIWI
jgi:nucleotide-binding universal stress UspA family protein